MPPLATFTIDGQAIELRSAVADDVPAIVALLADDHLGRTREQLRDGDLTPYRNAFVVIDQDPTERVLVATARTRVIATFQLSFLPGLGRRGALRAQIEAVRVEASFRGAGLGAALMRWAIEDARRRGCALVQLTSDDSRTDAHRFYERIGFTPSHRGFKLEL